MAPLFCCLYLVVDRQVHVGGPPRPLPHSRAYVVLRSVAADDNLGPRVLEGWREQVRTPLAASGTRNPPLLVVPGTCLTQSALW